MHHVQQAVGLAAGLAHVARRFQHGQPELAPSCVVILAIFGSNRHGAASAIVLQHQRLSSPRTALLLNHKARGELVEGFPRIAQPFELILAHADGDAVGVVADQPPGDAQFEEWRIP